MTDFSNYPFPTYIPNKTVAYIFTFFVLISFLSWLIQSIQNRFQPIRIIILLLLSHLTILSELIIRATSNILQQNSKIIYIIMTVLYTIGQRSIIVANFTMLIQFSNKKPTFARWIFLGISLSIILSDILMTPAGFLSFQSHNIHLSFLFRQISTSMICLITIAFYFIWFWTNTFPNMSYETILLLVLSSLSSLITAFFLLTMSLPKYYIEISDDEEWFYYFQILPIVITLVTWSMLHPKRSLQSRNQLIIERESNEKKPTCVF